MIVAIPDFLLVQAEHRAIHEDVLAPRELGVEPGAQLQQRCDAPVQLHRPRRRRQRSANELQQRRLARAVPSDDAHRRARRYVEAHVPQRPEITIEAAPAAPRELLQPIAGPLIHLVALAQVSRADGVLKGHRRSPSSSSRTTPIPATSRTQPRRNTRVIRSGRATRCERARCAHSRR